LTSKFSQSTFVFLISIRISQSFISSAFYLKIADVLATAPAHDFQLDLSKFKGFQLFLEALLGLNAEQQQEIIVEEFYEDTIIVFTTCIEFTKVFSCLAYGDAVKNKSRKVKSNSIDSYPGEDVSASATVVNTFIGIESSSEVGILFPISSSSGSSKDASVPTAGTISRNIPNTQESSQELLSDLVGEALSVAVLCCNISLNNTACSTAREKQGGEVARRKTLEEKTIVCSILDALDVVGLCSVDATLELLALLQQATRTNVQLLEVRVLTHTFIYCRNKTIYRNAII
jgi:hypothetical protein